MDASAADGSYSFADLRPGTYQVNEAQPAAYLDGKDTTGSTGGSNAAHKSRDHTCSALLH